MSFYRGPKIVRDSITLMLDAADKNSYPGSGNNWVDLSGNGYSATGINSPTYSLTKNGTLNFNGTNQKFQSSYSTSTTPFGQNNTWEAWIYCTSNISTYNMFMGAYLPYFSFYSGTAILFSNIYGGAQQSIQTSNGSVVLNTWYHIACTSQYNSGPNNTSMAIYINGASAQTGTATGAQTTSSTTNFMVGDGCGPNIYTNWYPFQGNVSCARIYSRALSAAEVLQNFNATRGRFGV